MKTDLVGGVSAKWLLRIVRWMEAAENKIPEPAFLKGEFPDWVNRLGQQLIATLFPAARLKPGRVWTASEIGAMLGHNVAYWHAVADMPKITKGKFRKLDRKMAKRLKRQVGAFAKAHERAITKSLALAVSQPYTDAAQFFTAFAQGLNRKPADLEASNFHRTTTRVYWTLLQGWPSVARLKSVQELQQALCRYLEPHVVGDVKRIEKICQRLGLHFAPRGRPKLNENRCPNR